VNVCRVVSIHETRRTLQIATVGEVDDEHHSAPGLDGSDAVMFHIRLVVTPEVLAGVQRFHPTEECRIRREHILERAVLGARLAHDDASVLFDNGSVDDTWPVAELGEASGSVYDRIDSLAIALRA
jgi:hypothetical protein